MRQNRLLGSVLAFLLTAVQPTIALAENVRQYRLGPLSSPESRVGTEVLVTLSGWALDFAVEDARVAAVQVTIVDSAKTVVFDSGVQQGPEIRWELGGLDWQQDRGPYQYRLSAWDSDDQPIGYKLGEINLASAGSEAALAMNVDGDFTIGGYLGIGTDTPERAVHLKGSNAVFRMDRSADTAAFILVRTDDLGNPLKSYVVGANASAPNQGEFIINDIGAAVGGAGQRRLTITNSGDTIFGGNVTASEYFVPSSIRFKENVRRLEDPIGKLEQLRGVRFHWKVSGTSSVGVIAEEVAKVLPEAVSWDPDRKNAVGVNYDSLVALLIETSKAQQTDIEKLTTEVDELTKRVEAELRRAERLITARAGPR
jgi:hypothetical protein